MSTARTSLNNDSTTNINSALNPTSNPISVNTDLDKTTQIKRSRISDELIEHSPVSASATSSETKMAANDSKSEDDLATAIQDTAVDSLTGATMIKTKKGGWYYTGKFIAAAFAVGCGLTTVAALVTTLAVIAPAFLANPGFYVVAAILFSSTTFANYRMTRNDLPSIFLQGIKGLFNTEIVVDGKVVGYQPLSARRKAVLISGIILATAFGVAIGALTISSVISLPAAFAFLTAVSIAIPPFGIFFGAVTAICLTAVMINAFSKLAKAKNIKQSIIDVLKDLFLPHPIKDAGKSRARFIFERSFVWIALTVIAVASLTLAFWGETYTLKTCAAGLTDITAKLFHGSSALANILINVVTRGLALLAQVPFTIRTTLNPILQLFSRKTDAEKAIEKAAFEKANPTSNNGIIEPTVGAIASTVNAGGNGLVALSGKPIDIWSLIGTIGATINSFFSTFGNTIPDYIPSAQIAGNGSSPRSSTANLIGHFPPKDSDKGNDPSNPGNGGGNGKSYSQDGSKEEKQPLLTYTRTDSYDADVVPDLSGGDNSSTDKNAMTNNNSIEDKEIADNYSSAALAAV